MWLWSKCATVLTSQEISEEIKIMKRRSRESPQKLTKNRFRRSLLEQQRKSKQLSKPSKRGKCRKLGAMSMTVPDERTRYFSHLQACLLSFTAMSEILPGVLPIDIIVALPSESNIEALPKDTVSEVLLKSVFPAMHMRSVHVDADGNCLPRTGSILHCGNQ